MSVMADMNIRGIPFAKVQEMYPCVEGGDWVVKQKSLHGARTWEVYAPTDAPTTYAHFFVGRSENPNNLFYSRLMEWGRDPNKFYPTEKEKEENPPTIVKAHNRSGALRIRESLCELFKESKDLAEMISAFSCPTRKYLSHALEVYGVKK